MWLAGIVTQEEMRQIEEQGWDVDRILTADEVNNFFGKNSGYAEEPKNDNEKEKLYPLIWIDSDLFENLYEWHDRALAEQNRHGKQKLEKERRIAADEEFSEYDFHENGDLPMGCDIIDSNGWETDGLDCLIKGFYWDNPDGGNMIKSSFLVRFKQDEAKVDDVHANVN